MGIGFAGGSASSTVIVELEPGDIINYQVYDFNTNREVKTRIWLRGYFLRPTD